ncbi:MAG: hypothetical protein PWQ77_1462 [Kosmotogales bacterium]|nr:hypothetical protein [Kosmotogales bacterium]
MKIEYIEDTVPDIESLENLYNDAGFSFYTKDMKKLYNAIKKSLFVVSAWHDNVLVGLARAVGDGETILYIQDILVLKSYKRKRIGTASTEIIVKKYPHVRQKVLLTDDTAEMRYFYESLDFVPCDKGNLVAFVKFD